MAKASKPESSKATPYRVIVLKYRPQTFEDIVGQEHIKQALCGAITKNKIAHAFLFAGSRGTGKTTSARILAKALNCLSSDAPTITPCGECVACKEIADSHDMDVLEIDGASNNSVEQVRELLVNIENRPARDRYRVVIIDEVHMLSTAAFNALLKTLEEPPAHVKFIFATTDPHKVPETIHSRCQHYDFRRLSGDEIVSSLQEICDKEGVSADAEVLRAIASISEGGMRDSQSKLDQLIAFRGESISIQDVEEVFGLVGRSRLIALLGMLRGADLKGVLALADDVVTTGKDVRAFILGMLEVLRHALVIRSCGDDARSLDLTGDDRGLLEAEAKQWSSDSLVYAIELLSEAGRRIKGAEYPRVTLETLLYKLCRLPDLKPIDDVIASLDAVIASGAELVGSVQVSPGQSSPSPGAGKAAAAPKPEAAPAASPTSHAAKTPSMDDSPSTEPVPAAPSESSASMRRAKDLIKEVFEIADDASM